MADRRLQVFHAVAKHLSFTKAAEALFMTQPAVTFQIRQLEEHFDTRLFDRAHGPHLAHAGRAGRARLRRAHPRPLGGARHAPEGDERPGGAGRCSSARAPPSRSSCCRRCWASSRRATRRVVPRLFVANSEAVQERIAERTLDLGFIEGDSHLPSLVTDVCCDDELRVVCAPSHPLARLQSVDAQGAHGARLHQPRARVGHARGHRPLPAEVRACRPTRCRW